MGGTLVVYFKNYQLHKYSELPNFCSTSDVASSNVFYSSGQLKFACIMI